MPRLFTALALPDWLRQRLALFQGGLPGARWVEPEDYHITLRFAGDISADLAEDFTESLSEIRFKPFSVRLTGLACFGGKKPRALYVGIAPSEPLSRLQMAHEQAAQRVGLAPERRKFQPHITLARLRQTTAEDVAGYLAMRSEVIAEDFTVQGFGLYSARASRGGGPYIEEVWYAAENLEADPASSSISRQEKGA